jgi:hypothetical protein
VQPCEYRVGSPGPAVQYELHQSARHSDRLLVSKCKFKLLARFAAKPVLYRHTYPVVSTVSRWPEVGAVTSPDHPQWRYTLRQDDPSMRHPGTGCMTPYKGLVRQVLF